MQGFLSHWLQAVCLGAACRRGVLRASPPPLSAFSDPGHVVELVGLGLEPLPPTGNVESGGGSVCLSIPPCLCLCLHPCLPRAQDCGPGSPPCPAAPCASFLPELSRAWVSAWWETPSAPCIQLSSSDSGRGLWIRLHPTPFPIIMQLGDGNRGGPLPGGDARGCICRGHPLRGPPAPPAPAPPRSPLSPSTRMHAHHVHARTHMSSVPHSY